MHKKKQKRKQKTERKGTNSGGVGVCARFFLGGGGRGVGAFLGTFLSCFFAFI